MNTKLRCLLLDDELPGLTYLKMLCEQLPEVEVVKAYVHPADMLQDIGGLDIDFCIIDIEMPDINGLQVAELLRNIPVIFATAYKEYAADAFDLHAIDYLRKPIKAERLRQAIEKVKKHLEQPRTTPHKKFVQLNTNKGKALLFFEHIAYIKSSEIDSRDKVIRLFDGEELTAKNITFEKLLEVLPANDFSRVNKREMLSIKAVKIFLFDEITTHLTDKQGKTLKVALNEQYRADFLKKIKL